MKKEIIEQIRADELPEELRAIAKYCGLNVAHILLLNLCGASIYIPRIVHLSKFIKRYIIENWDRSTVDIAKDLNISVPYVHRMRKKIKKEKIENKINSINSNV